MPHCSICHSTQISEIHTNYPGYIEGQSFKILHCKNCGSHTIPNQHIPDNIYETIYNSHQTPGYDRYAVYAANISKAAEPLEYLASHELNYEAIARIIKNLPRLPQLQILEIGCGYGYLTYALNQLGHKTHGIDVSKHAIADAIKNFGNNYTCADITSFAATNQEQFDLVIATEVIEHVQDIDNFIESCKKILTPSGKIILTTPNRDYASAQAIWQTDLPPVHVSWWTKKGFELFANRHNLWSRAISLSGADDPMKNLILSHLFAKNKLETIPAPVLKQDGSINTQAQFHLIGSRKMLHSIFVDNTIIRKISNNIYGLFQQEYPTLGIILEQKK